MIEEVGKTWPEADADTAEAIDFLEFYAREMLRYAAKQPVTKIPSEKNELIYIPLGVGVVRSAVEFCACHPCRNDISGGCGRQYGGAETIERFSADRLDVLSTDAGSRSPGWSD